MAYRNGTYVAFHAAGTTDPTASDIKYYRMLLAWTKNKNFEFKLINSHDKTASVRDTSLRETLRRRLVERLANSKNMLLIITEKTRQDTDWVPFEISYAVDKCRIPIIAAYPGFDRITAPALLSDLWPVALRQRINDASANVIHIPFRQLPIEDAIGQFNHDNLPLGGGLGIYSAEAYRAWE